MSKYWNYVFDESLLEVDLNSPLNWETGKRKGLFSIRASCIALGLPGAVPYYIGSLHGTPCCVRSTPNPKQNHIEINRIRKDMGLMRYDGSWIVHTFLHPPPFLTISGCQHPNLITFLGTCLRKSQAPLGHCVVTEYCEGDSMRLVLISLIVSAARSLFAKA